MRRWITFLSALCCILLAASTAFAATGAPKGWSKVGKAGTTHVYNASFGDSTHGLANFYGVGFKKTSDGGKTWKNVSTMPAGFGMNELVMASSSVGYIAGTDVQAGGCVIYRTGDGGKTWVDKRSQLGHGQIYAVFATDGTHAWAVGTGMLIFATTDGGKTWHKQYGDYYGMGELRSVFFTDKLHGWAAGETWPGDEVVVYRTIDGGASWVGSTIPVNNTASAVGFADKRHGWVVTAPTPMSASAIYASADGGVTWTPQTVTGCRSGAYCFGFASASKGWMVSNYLFQTTDGGKKWSPYWTTSVVSAFSMPNHSNAYAFVRNAADKTQLYRWKSTSPASVPRTPASALRTLSAVHYHLKSFKVPRTTKRNKWFNVRVSLTPRYNGSGRVVTFYLQGWTGSRWKSVNHKAVHGVRSGSKTVFGVRIRLSRASWRLRARFHKSGSPTVWTAYKRIRVT